MNGLQVRKLIVIRVNAHAKEKASIATVHNLVVPELRERGKIVGQGINNENIDARACVPQRNWIGISGLAPRLVGAPRHVNEAMAQVIMFRTNLHLETQTERTFSSSSYGTYHFDNRVLPWRF